MIYFEEFFNTDYTEEAQITQIKKNSDKRFCELSVRILINNYDLREKFL
jgi:hypothetical protein